MLTVTILVGNPKAHSRTLKVAESVVANLLGTVPHDTTVIDLADHTSRLFDWPSIEMDQLLQQAAASNLLVVASPTYKATYTGLLKAFLDRYPNKGLRGVTAIPVMTGADASHSLGPDVHLRPLLVELGASVPTAGLYFTVNHMNQLEHSTATWAAEAATVLSLLQPLLQGAIAAHEPPLNIVRPEPATAGAVR